MARTIKPFAGVARERYAPGVFSRCHDLTRMCCTGVTQEISASHKGLQMLLHYHVDLNPARTRPTGTATRTTPFSLARTFFSGDR